MNKYFLLLLILTIVVATPALVFAQNEVKLNLTYPSIDIPGVGILNLATNQDLTEIVSWFLGFLIGIAGFATFIMLVWGGFQWLISAGNPSQIGEAKDKIQKALLGLLLVLSSVLILQFVNPTFILLTDPGLTPLTPLPFGATAPGVYLCAIDGCQGGENFFLFTDKDIMNLRDFGWNDTATALAISGAFDVRVYEDIFFGGRHICFKDSVARLDDFPIVPKNGWAFDISSVKVLAEGSCTNPGVTVLPTPGALTVSLAADGQADSTTVSPGSTALLTWDASPSFIVCTGSSKPPGFWSGQKPLIGSEQVGPFVGPGNHIFSLHCQTSTVAENDLVTIVVSTGGPPDPTPTVDLKIDPDQNGPLPPSDGPLTLPGGSLIQVILTSTNATECWGNAVLAEIKGQTSYNEPKLMLGFFGVETFEVTCFNNTGQSASDQVVATFE